MGKQPSPSPEELEFISECFTRGLSDWEVLGEMQDTEFPLRKIRFMRDKRREFNATRKVLEVTLKQQVDPALVKAKEEHFAEIRSLIEVWKDAVQTPKVDETSLSEEGYLKVPFSKHEYQFNPLFDCLKEHLPFPTLWQNHSLWINRIPDYFDNCKNLIKEITEDNRVVKWLEENPTREECVIVEPVLRCISDRALGKEPKLLNQPDPETGELESFMEITTKPGTYKFIERTSKTSFTTQGTIESVVYVDPAICTYYFNRPEATHVVDLFIELRDLEIKIRESLNEILIKRDYIIHTCQLCPEQAK